MVIWPLPCIVTVRYEIGLVTIVERDLQPSVEGRITGRWVGRQRT